MNDLLSAERFASVWQRVASNGGADSFPSRDPDPIPSSHQGEGDTPLNSCLFLAERAEEERLLVCGLSCQDALHPFARSAKKRVMQLNEEIGRLTKACYSPSGHRFPSSWLKDREDFARLSRHLARRYAAAPQEGIKVSDPQLWERFLTEHRELQAHIQRYF